MQFLPMFGVGLALAGIFSANVRAHQDPVGDVYPVVVVESGRFAIYFANNISGRYPREQFRVIFSPTGELIAPRHPSPTARKGQEALWQMESPVSNDEVEVNVGVGGDIVTLTGRDGATEHRRLLWDDGVVPFQRLEDFAVSDTHLVLLGTFQNPDDPFQNELGLAVFDLSQPLLPVIIRLGGKVATIYDFPTCSHLVVVDGLFYVAWMKEAAEEAATVPQLAFNLTSLDPVMGKTESRELAADFNWNTQISMAAIGDRLCIAWHGGMIYGGFVPAKIEKLFISVPVEVRQ